MTAFLIIVIIVLGARLAYLEFGREARIEAAVREYENVIAWYQYLIEKETGADFDLWKKELDERD